MFYQYQNFPNSTPALISQGNRVGSLASNASTHTNFLVAQVAQPAESYQFDQRREANFDEIAMMGIGLLFLFGMLWLIFRKKREHRYSAESIHAQQEDTRMRSLAVPCRHCHYFHPNLHLQCAVHPDMVLKRQAAECTDYLNRKEQEDMAA